MVAAIMLTSLPDSLNLLIIGSFMILFGVLLRRVLVSFDNESELNSEENLASKDVSQIEHGFARSPLAASSHEATVLAGTLKQFSLARPN